MTWLRDGAKVSAAKMETKAEGDSHSLVIKNATIEDVGEYICQAENVTSKTELEVQSKEEKIEVENHIMQQMGIKGENIYQIMPTTLLLAHPDLKMSCIGQKQQCVS